MWPPVLEWFDEISEKISEKFNVKWKKRIFLGNDFNNFARRIYSIDDIERWKVERKLYAMREYRPEIQVLALEISNPEFRVKKRTNGYLSDVGAALKKRIRSEYRDRVPDYIYDIVCHTGDNQEHNKESFKIIAEYKNKE